MAELEVGESETAVAPAVLLEGEKDFDSYKGFSLKQERPKGRGKITSTRYKREMSINDYIPHLHACLVGKRTVATANPNGEGTDFIVNLYMTGGCNSGDENPFMEDNKRLKELTIHVRRADIKVWNIKTTNLIFPASMTRAASVQWSDSCFSVFGYYDPQQRIISDKLIHIVSEETVPGKLRWKKEIVNQNRPRPASGHTIQDTDSHSQTVANTVWPSSRYGHSLSKIGNSNSEKALICGGVNMPNRNVPRLIAHNTFKILPANDIFYIYSKNKESWHSPGISSDSEAFVPLSWHASISSIENQEYFVLVNGGLTYGLEGKTWISQPLSVIYKIQECRPNIIKIVKEKLHLNKEIYISGHNLLMSNNCLLVVGGVSSPDPKVKPIYL